MIFPFPRLQLIVYLYEAMRFDTLPQIEMNFRKEAAAFLKGFSLQVPGENLELNGQLFKPGRTNYFYPVAYPKKRIVLHFTAGNLRSDMLSLTQQNRHVSVAFVVARDGTIYQLFPSRFWSGHIGAGIGNAGTGNSQDKATIGIELSNYGYLVPREGHLETIYSRMRNTVTGRIGPVDRYCSLSDQDAFLELDAPFREQRHYASFTAEQVESTIILLRFLTARYNIPRAFLPADKRFVPTNAVLQFEGIVSHVNYRSSGKWDIGPAFDWNALIKGVTEASFTPVAVKEISTERGWEPGTGYLSSEEEIEAEFPIERTLQADASEENDNDAYNPADFNGSPINGQAASASGRIYALLIGINNYARIRKLKGCIRDVEKVEAWLRSFDENTSLLKLLDAAASRQAIAQAFDTHLAQAGPDDSIFIYYSGHGTQEEAGAFWQEPDGRLECLVCHDEGAQKPADFLLTDKELRYLLHAVHQKTGAHILTVFDCCHSGDNTRNAALATTAYDDDEILSRSIINVERASGAFPQRAWNEFLFGHALQEPPLQDKKPAEWLPEASHVQLSACESDQTALEVNGEGVFTRALLNTLDASGADLSYQVLANRVRQLLRTAYEQTPRIYVAGAVNHLLNTCFLNKARVWTGFQTEVIHNENKGWQLNAGALHGLEKNSRLFIEQPGKDGSWPEATINEIYLDHARITLPFPATGDKIFKARVDGLMTHPLLLSIENVNGHPKDVRLLLDLLLQRSGGHFSFQGTDEQLSAPADFTLHIRGGDAFLTRPGDPFRPVTRQLPFTDEKDIEPVLSMLRHLSQWHFISRLENSHTAKVTTSPLVSVSISRILTDGSTEVQAIRDDAVVLGYNEGTGNFKGAMQVSIANNSEQRLYVAVIYLTNAHRAYLDLVPGRTRLLGPGESFSLELNGDTVIPYSLDDFVIEYNWPLGSEILKIIVSQEEFKADALALGPLPGPITLNSERSILPREALDLDQKPVAFSGWYTQTIHLLFANPLHNSPNAQTLQAMLQDEDLVWFAAGLYYDLAKDEQGEPTKLVLKEGIKLPEEERGLWGDLTLWLANRIETLQRRKLYRRLKDTGRLRIVAEGDSWFQYPLLLKDILDHLYKLYAVYNLAEAGDTMEHYMQKKEYLQPLAQEEAGVFIISGGGNDILGAQFRDFLRNSPVPGEAGPARYLQDTFFEKLGKLNKWYFELFSELTGRFPTLRIITHGYDHIIPVDTEAAPGRTSWLGRYMVEKKIGPQQEREKLIRFIVDKFNEQLEEASRQFPGRVAYIDLRGTVDRDSWFDEIHPSNAGFQQIADRFISAIEGNR